jgi:hypothetical protein
MKEIMLFYTVGAIIVGATFASMKEVSIKFNDKPLPLPRLIGAIIVGAFWPLAILQWVILR